MTAVLPDAPASGRDTAPRPGRGGERAQVVALRFAALVAAVIAWAAVTAGPLRESDYVAGPVAVLTDGLRYVLLESTLQALWTTTFRFLVAFAIAGVVGVVLGVLFGRAGSLVYGTARDATMVLYTLPLVPFYPLFVLWLGLGAKSEIAFGAIHGVIPVILVTMSAAARVSGELLLASTALGAGRAQRFGKVVLPAIVPDLVGALRVGAALSLLGVLLGELMISVDGVGDLMAQMIANLRPAELNAVVLAVCVGAVLINSVMTAMERHFSRWRG